MEGGETYGNAKADSDDGDVEGKKKILVLNELAMCVRVEYICQKKVNKVRRLAM